MGRDAVGGQSLGHQIRLDGLGPLVTNCSAERAVPGLVGMPLDQEDALPIAAPPRRVPVEDAHVTWPHLRGPRRKETGESASGTSGATSRAPKPAKTGATKASSGKIITDVRRLTSLLAIGVRTVCPRMLDSIRGAKPETQSSRDVPVEGDVYSVRRTVPEWGIRAPPVEGTGARDVPASSEPSGYVPNRAMVSISTVAELRLSSRAPPLRPPPGPCAV
jgi:hypothetical protein